ncbi:hypothetical protein F5Y19DRAFT_491000 [Xylariaceae sp. FL1651]|nr:hypothetical protein F5Y19DRAFT_491000 [Xylariaceae sp. FL1651]
MSESSNYFMVPPVPRPGKDYRQNLSYNKLGDQTGGPSVNIVEGTTIYEYNWVVSYIGLDPRIQNGFYLTFGDSSQGFGSHYFNTTGGDDGASESTTSSSSTITSAPTSTSMSTSTSFSSTSATIASTSTLPTNTVSQSATPGAGATAASR